MIVPYPAGGPTDAIGRILAEAMRAPIGQPVVIDNVAGASGSIGVGRAARAAPDGYTLSLGSISTHVVNGAVLTLPYDLRTDFEPVALVAANPLLIVAKRTMPANDLQGLVAWLKANPGKASEGLPGGLGSLGHVASVSFHKEMGTGSQFVPYRGGAAAMQDLVAGQIDMMFDLAGNSSAQVRGGSIKAYAVTTSSRWSTVPDIPTVDEAGLPGFHISQWHALWAPKGTSRDIIGKLNAAVVMTLADPVVRRRLADLSQEIPPRTRQTPEALGEYHKAEIEKWWPIIKSANIKAE
jgi:tripartite-type tricarboxylate transporter receptor subunit TctC